MTPNQKRVLFVCSVLGVRSLIASHFCDLFSKGAIQSVAAGFQQGSYGSRIKTFAETRGIHLPSQSPSDVFSLHRAGECFDYVVTLCNDAAREQCPIFMRSVDTLFKESKVLGWHIPDFQSIEGDENFIFSCWDQIVSDIEIHVRQFVSDVLAPEHQTLGKS